jgi:hypothetical protein
MKYWVLSRKIKQIVDKTIDKNLPIKANLIFYFQVLLILVANGCQIAELWNAAAIG